MLTNEETGKVKWNRNLSFDVRSMYVQARWPKRKQGIQNLTCSKYIFEMAGLTEVSAAFRL